MIVVDIETSGVYPEKHGIWQIGALDYNNPENTFLEESRIDINDEITEESLKVTGKKESELRDNKKQSEKELLQNFFSWTNSIKMKNMLSHNFFDYMFLTFKARKYGLQVPFKHRAFDLHSMAQAIYHMKNGEFLIKEENDVSYSDMNLIAITNLCGLQDKRMRLKDGKVVEHGTPHNALEDAKIEVECLRRLLE